ncbi:heparan-alpha-glucosaminide N-acetyltransferase domain-containing protein [Streptomyces sp. VNUA24]|uniref:heparan-alpha-glucosaminide N-acetyltransferase domain-containing protein n=1 Tax=Streptomyces sp. VNUA24 TaxID=3031131 RepID=UPI0023B774F7|nr:heparan-alpha-glucosaminide N-acetyltransferase domain-containing protein [Streptomyces sp. VNUA24]WEH12368.1 heparan-alpha-glucosaminide N-acetyltransferase domain-containing protein [Streptomyces sp. VNUA24]
MTQIEIPHETPPSRPGAPAGPVGVAGQKPTVGRLAGVDLARALAVFGMFAVHVAPAPEDVSGFRGWLLQLAFGRSSVLFAMLAGFSLMLIAGRREPKTGLAGRQAKARIAIRAVVLLALGTALTILQNGIIVILAFYGVYFLLALPLVRLRARTLAITAAVLALVAPQAAFGLERLLSPSLTNTLDSYDPIDRLGGDGLLDLLLNGTYPTITWLPYVIAGMALARVDLAAGVVQRRLAALGAALTALGYGAAWLAPKLFPSLRAYETGANGADMASMKELFANMEVKSLEPGSAEFEAIQNSFQDRFDTNPSSSTVLDLLGSDPHTGTTFDIVGSLGVAITVLVCATVAMERLGWLRRLASPLVAVGTMSLTLYVAHVVAYAMLPERATDTFVPLLGFIAGAILFAAVWSRFFRRGPLEHLLNSTTKLATFVR